MDYMFIHDNDLIRSEEDLVNEILEIALEVDNFRKWGFNMANSHSPEFMLKNPHCAFCKHSYQLMVR